MDIFESSKKVESDGLSVQNGAHEESHENEEDKQVSKRARKLTPEVFPGDVYMLRPRCLTALKAYQMLPKSKVFCNDCDLLCPGQSSFPLMYPSTPGSMVDESKRFFEMIGLDSPFQAYVSCRHLFSPRATRRRASNECFRLRRKES